MFLAGYDHWKVGGDSPGLDPYDDQPDNEEEGAMPIIAKKPDSQFSTAPEGLHQAVCCDVVDLGLVDGPFGQKHKVELWWQLDETDPKSQARYTVRQRYTLSLDEKANLRRDLESWRGRKFTELELGGFDLEKLIGVNAQIQIIHNLSDKGTTFANVQAIVPALRNMPKLSVSDYVRKQDRAKAQGNGPVDVDVMPDEESIPF